MTKPNAKLPPSADRITADRLRELRKSVRDLGKRSLIGMLDAGEALEEAAKLLRGNYSTWVLAECGIDARTALGYRKTFRVLNDRRKWLVGKRVAPSVALTIACAKPEGRDRALAALEADRTLTVKEAKALVRGGDAKARPPTQGLGSLARSVAAFSTNLLAEIARIVELAADPDADEFRLMESAVRARVLMPILSALSTRTAGAADPVPHPLTDALTALASATTAAEIAAAAAHLVVAASGNASDEAGACPTADVPPQADAPNAGIRSTTSALTHGLTVVEICAGAGGQAAGLSKAGFRHLALLERDPSACETLRAAFGPDHVVEADLIGYDPGEIGDVDLLAGGVPCQGYSRAGHRKGAGDERDLFAEALRLAEQLRPRAVMIENVETIFEPDYDLHRFRVLGRLKRMGYAAEWRTIDSSHFGVPQNRKRAFLVAFRERAAMDRFRWPTALHHYGTEPHPVIAGLDGHLRSGGWVPTEAIRQGMDRAAPTVTGGSDRKNGMDLGQSNTAKVWAEMGFVTKRIGNGAPGPDHDGKVEATNGMLATLQGFPSDWPFRGSKKQVYRQIGNALPPPVAFHLGCAVASALTRELVDPAVQIAHEGMRWIHRHGQASGQRALEHAAGARPSDASRSEVGLALARLGNRMPTWVSEDRWIDFDDEGSEPLEELEGAEAIENAESMADAATTIAASAA
ncbi:DNA cytosine methyltransferase [Aureimonas ureilytica]|uniref:DNA cytosine methyltransferase n=1 Tax=Aureimonas ureilytica TaxID=401562 RepID=UPI00036E7959|nr:DNA (cytosine-5-)-methyltransferase [Aureimonas ureilytica]